MNTLSLEDIEILTLKLEDYNNSPWEIFLVDITLDELKSIAEKESMIKALDVIRRADIAAFHAEEASCGCI